MATSGLLKPVTPIDAKAAHDDEQIIILDCRPASSYLLCHITKSIFGVFDRSQPNQDPLTWVGLLVQKKRYILLVTCPGDEELAYKTLADFGFTMIMGYKFF